MVEVCGVISCSRPPIVEVILQPLYRGTYTDHENTSQPKIAMPMQTLQAHMASGGDIAVFRSKEWLHLDAPDR